MSQCSLTYSIISNCSGGTCKSNSNHYHTTDVSELNMWLKDNVPSNAVITKVVYESKSTLDYSAGSSIMYASIKTGLYYGDGEDDGVCLNDEPIETKVYRETEPIDLSVDITSYFSTTYPFSMSTASPKLVLCFTTNNTLSTSVSCEYARIVVYYNHWTTFHFAPVNNVYEDIIEINGASFNSQAGFQCYNNESYNLRISSFDGRRIIGFQQYDSNDTLMTDLSGDALTAYLDDELSTFNLNFQINESMLNKEYRVVVTFDTVVYITFDSYFNTHKWFHEGMTETGVTNASPTGFTFTCKEGVSGIWTPLFPIVAGSYNLSFKYSSYESDPYIRIEYKKYNNQMEVISAGDLTYDSLDSQPINIASDGYISISVMNSLIGSTATFSNFVLYPTEYSYMRDTLAASDRTITSSWVGNDVPLPNRENYEFIGFNTSDGQSYTGQRLEEDTVCFSLWEKIGSNVFLGNTLMDVYLGTTLMDVYVGTTWI